MRILHLVDRLTERGGAYRHLLGMIEWLSSRGHAQLLACGEMSAETTVACPGTVVQGLAARVVEPVALDAVHGDFEPDVIHVHTVVNPAALSWAAHRGAVMTVQDHRLFCPGRGKWTADGRVCGERMSREVCRACFEDERYFSEILGLTEERLEAVREMAAVTVLSRYMRDELVAVGVEGTRLHVIPPFAHGLDPGTEADGPPCVLFAGRLAESKGVLDAVAAWRGAATGLPLVFAGTGPLRTELEAEGFEVLGWLDRLGLSRAYKRAQAVLLPSRWQEPFGIVGLEALSLGVPVVAYDSGGVREWHPGDGLVPWGDVGALAGALAEAVARRAQPLEWPEVDTLMTRLMAVYGSSARMPAEQKIVAPS